ncbi:MAG TPA: ABC transporter ATP-binding protein [Candidatus Limnocylindrales bacterium]|nr:ABC transporter ATP-binding protein [Candidatus Limnocylindrales bacterium]
MSDPGAGGRPTGASFLSAEGAAAGARPGVQTAGREALEQLGHQRGSQIRIEGLVKHFGDVRAVAGVSLGLEAGEFLALLGPSGSGKTTILMCLAGFERATGGRIFIDDEDVTTTPPDKRDIGMVFQRYALFPHMSVLDNVAFPLRMRRRPRAEREALARAALELVRLPGVAERRPHQLSGGQQQRVALARAIVFRPRLLLMDEPLGALDKKLRESLQLEIKQLQRQLGTTVLYVTHDQHEALTMADRIAVMHEGAVQQVGPPQQLYEEPANTFVADFLGETSFVDGVVADLGASAACRVATAGGRRFAATLAGPDVVRAGDPVRVAIRPERVVLRPSSADHDGLAGRVIEAVYDGASTLHLIESAEGQIIRARLPAGVPPVPLGDRVDLVWEPSSARAYRRER